MVEKEPWEDDDPEPWEDDPEGEIEEENTEKNYPVEESEPLSELDALRLENAKRIKMLINEAWSKIGAEDDAQEEQDALIRHIQSVPEMEKFVRGVVGILHALARFEDPQKVVITMQKIDKTIQFTYKMYNADGSETMFDSDGNVIKIRSTKSDAQETPQ